MFKKKKKTNKILHILTLTSIFCLSRLLIFADKLPQIKLNRTFENSAAFFANNQKDWYIYLSDIDLTNIDPSDIKFIYIVQPWDSLYSIAQKFNISVSTIKTINKLKSDIIRPGQKLIITDEEWILYEIKERISLKNFAKKYWLNLENLKKANYFINDDLILDKWDEIFIPISEKEAIQKWLLKQQTFISQYKPKKKVKIKIPVYNKNIGSRRQYKCKKNPNIVACRYYNPKVVNLFAPGHCTRFVAIKKFPFINSHRQSRPWRWNAKEWLKNAKLAGFKTGKRPIVNSIVVFKYGWRKYYRYWHVAIVLWIDKKHNKILIEEMNYIWRFIADKRRVDINNPKIIGYIYY